MGTAPFSVPSLEALKDHISLVVSQPDHRKGRGMRSLPSPVKERALELGLPVETPEKCRELEFVKRLEQEKADFLLVAAYGQILSQKVLDSTKRGGINLHGSILPKYRGAAPIQRAIMEGELETGVTLMQMDKGMDTGDIIAIERISIHPSHTYGDLTELLGNLAAEMCTQWLDRLANGDYPRIQQDSSKATYASKITNEERALNIYGDAKQAYNRFRGLSPVPGAYLHTQFGRLKIIEADWNEAVGVSGTILSTLPDLVIAFGTGSLILRKLQPEGRKLLNSKEFANGYRLKKGIRLC